MKLIKIEEKQRVDLEKSRIYKGTYFEIGSYEVEHYMKYNTDNELIVERISVSYKDYNEARENYIPEIYFYDGIFRNKEKGFDIQTTSYGALKPEEIKKVVAGYEEALKVVEILTQQFC